MSLLSAGRAEGVFIKLPAIEVIDLLAASTFSFVVVDLEHSALTESDALRLVRHASTINVPVVVRIAALDRGLINRLLEQGASGIQLSTVRSIAEASGLVAATRYHPEGRRSVSLAHAAAGYGAKDLEQFVADAAAERPLAIAQIETAETDDPLADIFATGIDIAFVGMTDLNVSVEFAAERLEARVGEIAAAAAVASVALGGANCPHPDVRYAIDQTDIGLLRSAL